MAVKLITAKELYKKMKAREEVVMADVRAEEKYNQFHINGVSVTTIHLPKTEIFALRDEKEMDLSALPEDKELIITCTTGNSAAKCAAILDQHNYDVTVLEGGITAWRQESIDRIWAEFKSANTKAPESYSVWSFGDSKEMGDELAKLVIAGKKTATASNYALYELENEALPYAGLHNIIVDGSGMAAAVVETTAVEIIPFSEVTEEHAYLEGEGDRSLQYWRTVHEEFFRKELEAAGRTFDMNMPVVCECFSLRYKRSSSE